MLPGTIDNSVLSFIIPVLSFKGIHDGICNLRFFSMRTRLLQGWMSIKLHSPLFSDKVDNTDGLNQLQMDTFGCMVQGSFLTHMYSVGRHSRRSSSSRNRTGKPCSASCTIGLFIDLFADLFANASSVDSYENN